MTGPRTDITEQSEQEWKHKANFSSLLDPLVPVIARMFHEAYEALAPEYDYETKVESRKHWSQLPEKNKRLMKATVRVVLLRMLNNFRPEEWLKNNQHNPAGPLAAQAGGGGMKNPNTIDIDAGETIQDRENDDSEYQAVFVNCNVCGRPLIYVKEDELGMCLICAEK